MIANVEIFRYSFKRKPFYTIYCDKKTKNNYILKPASEGVPMDLIGNLVRIQSCPRNCVRRRNGNNTTVYVSCLWHVYGKESKVGRSASQETCLPCIVSYSSGIEKMKRW